MVWSLIAQVVKVILDVLSLHWIADPDRDWELLVLSQQTRVLERRVGKPVRPARVEKLLLTLTAMQIKARPRTGQQSFKNSLLLLKPATVLKGHRELVKRKWTFQRRSKAGGPE